MGCGSCSVENGMKAINMAYQRRIRGPRPYSDEELRSCLMNRTPGSPKLSFLSFANGFHGRTMGSLALTHAKWYVKLDFPAPDWPIAPFPQLRYPLEEFTRENYQEEQRCLEQVSDLIHKWEKRGEPVSGMCVEPIQGDGGDNHASPAFFQGLQDICDETGVYLMFDEVQTGGGVSGKYWAHEHFNLRHAPHVVAFSKRMLSGGFYFADEVRPTEGYRIFNTWTGDPIRLVLLEQVIKEVREEGLMANAALVGRYMLDGLKMLQCEFPGLVKNARGLGTLCAVDIRDANTRADVLRTMRNRGVNLGMCGVSGIRLRPSLLFKRRHVDIFLDRLRTTLAELK